MHENSQMIPPVGVNDALPLEYKRNYPQPRRQVDVSYFIGNSALKRFTRIHESHFQEEPVNVLGT